MKVKLVASGGKTEVVVYGTTQGVRADAQIGRRLDSATIDETPILGRKVTTLPLFNSAFRQGKGTGDLFVNATYFVTGGGSRRTTTFMLDGANNDEGWGRQTMLATVPIGAIQEISVLSNAFSAEFGWTAGPALNIVTKSGTNDAARRRRSTWAVPATGRRRRSRPTASARRRSRRCATPTTLHGDQPRRRAGRAEPVLGLGRRAARQGQDVLLRHGRLHDAGSDDVPVADAAVVRAAGRRQSRLRGQLPADAAQRARRSPALADARR